MSQVKKADLTTIASGVANELFARELERVAANIDDVNTSPVTKRKITLTFEFTPDDDRREAKLLVTSKSTLAPVKGFSQTVWCGKPNGKPTIMSRDEDQLDIFDKDVEPIRTTGGSAHA